MKRLLPTILAVTAIAMMFMLANGQAEEGQANVKPAENAASAAPNAELQSKVEELSKKVDLLTREIESQSRDLEPKLLKRVYSLEGLAAPVSPQDTANWENPYSQWIARISKQIAPESWGHGRIMAGFATNETIVVLQTAEVHAEIAAHLNTLRRAKRDLSDLGYQVTITPVKPSKRQLAP